ncbi:MAG TPA: CapA family protein [Actinomycetales bacterium]|nr:CapA family protein [Actinomycetales bacterium]
MTGRDGTPAHHLARRVTRRVHVALGCVLLAACTAGPASSVQGGPSSTDPAAAGRTATVRTTATPSPTATPATDPAGPPAPDGTLTLAFAGDVHFAGRLAPLLDHPTDALAELRPFLATADLAMVNLETAITTRGTEQPKKFHFRAPATALDALAGAGVDVVSMANNHAIDYGEHGFADTLAARADGPLPIVGIGRDRADALAPAVLQAEGLRVAFLGATQVPDWTLATWTAGANRPGVASASSPDRLAAAVRKARTRADVVVVYLHWGTDYTPCPNALQVRTAKALAQAGADVVVGTHAHQLQGAGWLGSTYVDYGLGNFVWWRRNSDVESRTGVLTLTLRGRRVVDARWTPMRVSADGIPRVPGSRERATLAGQWLEGQRCTNLADEPG